MASDWNAQNSDPKTRKLMQGFPPPPALTVRADTNLSGASFPNTRWSFSHQREMKWTANVRRGAGAAHAFPKKLRDDIDAISFTTMEGEATTLGKSLDTMFTDGIVILHRGVIIYETYRGALEAHVPHIAFSVTKSFAGLMAATLAHEGKLDPAAPVSFYIPELAQTAFGDATVRHVMDMTTGVQYSENYTDPNAEVRAYGIAAGYGPAPPGYTGPETIFDFLRTLKKQGQHGEVFAYKTCNTEVLAWIVQRLTDTPMAQLLSERLWQKLGVEEDAYIVVDRIGAAACGGGLNLTLRDLARFGEMMRSGGALNGQQIVPKAVVDDIANGGNRDHFAKANYVTLPGWSYRNQFWVSHDRFGAYTARGIHGQACWIAPKAEVVIA
ncbi:MAG TPA: serine hydrolase, partial [Hyphomonadaceae bacterium]|nr:serine hydrolase [Hyphomonadaceae bacterium]